LATRRRCGRGTCEQLGKLAGALSLVYGTFNNVHPPEHLTWLKISQATVFMCEDYDSHSPLLELHIDDCEISMPGLLGICAFTQLQVLECGEHAVVTAPDVANSLCLVAPIHVPAEFFSLSGLTRLSMLFLTSQAVDGIIDTKWLYSLSHLQHLTLQVFENKAHDVGLCMTFHEQLTHLNKLEFLMVAADVTCAIYFCVPWHLMTALQSVDFQGSAGIMGDILGLLEAPRLQSISYTREIGEDVSGNVLYAREAFALPWKKLEHYMQVHHIKHATVDCKFEFETVTTLEV